MVSSQVFEGLFQFGMMLVAFRIAACITQVVMKVISDTQGEAPSKRLFFVVYASVSILYHQVNDMTEFMIGQVRANLCAIGFIGTCAYYQIGTPLAICGAAMAVWFWVAVMLPHILGKLSARFQQFSSEARKSKSKPDE